MEILVIVVIIIIGILFLLYLIGNSSEQESSSTPQERSFTPQRGSFTDPRDGKVYKTVKIGRQTWMAENLNYEVEGSKSYDNDPANAKKYGQLYDWETAIRVCPPGWHLPSDKEWQELVNFAGGDKVAGKKLKATSGWNNNSNGTDDYGFAALPGSFCTSIGFGTGFGSRGLWWSSTEGILFSWYRYIDSEYNVIRSEEPKDSFFSVRCVKD